MSKVLAFFKKRMLILVVIILMIVSVALDKSYISKFNMMALLTDISIIGILALGEMMAIISGGIDLSVGCMASASSVFVAWMMIQLNGKVPDGVNLIASIAFALVFCAVLGFINGFSICKFGLPPMIATLGGEWIAKGIGYYMLNGVATPYKVKSFADLSRKGIGVVPYCFILFVVVVIVVAYIMNKRKAGRAVYAVGGNKQSAMLSGIKIDNVILGVYTASGVLAAISGFALGAYSGTGYVKGASNYELYAIASVAIGGVSMAGGAGDTYNAMLGVCVFRMIKKLMVYANLSDQLEGFYLGILLLIALFISTGSAERIPFVHDMMLKRRMAKEQKAA